MYEQFWCHVTMTYVFSAEITPPTKIALFALFWRFVRNRSKYRNNFNEQVGLLGNLVWAFQKNQNGPQLRPP